MEAVQFSLSEESIQGLKSLKEDIARFMRVMERAQMVPERGENLDTIQKAYRDEVAKRVHGIRSRSGITLEALAESVGMPVRLLEHIENGSLIGVGVSRLAPIAEALKVNLERICPAIDESGRIVTPGKEYNMGGYERPLYPPRGKSDGKTEGPD